MDKKLLAIAESDEGFGFQFYIEKAVMSEVENEDFVITGVASTTNIDHDNEKMSEAALIKMARIINEKNVPLRVEHQKNDDAIVGNIFKAWLDERNKLWIKALLDKNKPAAVMLKNALRSGAKLGLSVGGRVKRATRELVESTGKLIKTFYDVILDEVSVTWRPSNYDSWLVKKHYIEKIEDAQDFNNSGVESEFLFENPKLDYLMVFEKSIPEQAWKKVDEKENADDMKKKVNKEEENTEFESEEKSYASVEYVDKKFSEMSNLLKSFIKAVEENATGTKREEDKAGNADEVDAKDQELPEDKKEENPAQVRTVKNGANGDTSDDREANGNGKPLDEPALDAENPDTIKSVSKNFINILMKQMKKETDEMLDETEKENTEEEEKKTRKVKKEDTEEETEKENTEEEETEKENTEETDKMKKEDTEETEKEASDEDQTEKEEDVPDTDETEKADDDESTSSAGADDYDLPELKRTAKNISDIDVFASYVSQSIEGIEKRLEKNGKRVPD